MPELYPHLSHRAAHASHPLQTRLVSCAIPPSPWADPHTFLPEKLCSPLQTVPGERGGHSSLPTSLELGSVQEQLPAGLGCVARGQNQHNVPCKQWHEGDTACEESMEETQTSCASGFTLHCHFVSFLMCSTGLLHEARRREENIHCSCL